MSPSSFRTYSWIARQPFNVRYFLIQEKAETDGSENSMEYLAKYPKVCEAVPGCFKKGSLWPSLILIEKRSINSEISIEVFARIFKRESSLVVDVEVGKDIDEAHSIATKFKVPLYTKSWTKTGKLTGVRKLDTAQN